MSTLTYTVVRDDDHVIEFRTEDEHGHVGHPAYITVPRDLAEAIAVDLIRHTGPAAARRRLARQEHQS